MEVGCGDGRSLFDVLLVTQNITGVDHDQTAINHAKSKFRDYPNIKIIKAEGKRLPFQDEIFDYVTCIGTFANFGEEKYEILKEMTRVLKNSGYIIISVYSEKALSERLKSYKKINVPLKKVMKNGTVIFDDAGKDGISEQFSKKDLVEIFKKVNLKAELIKDAGIGYICKLSKL